MKLKRRTSEERKGFIIAYVISSVKKSVVSFLSLSFMYSRILIFILPLIYFIPFVEIF